jgi:hypothetical protein
MSMRRMTSGEMQWAYSMVAEELCWVICLWWCRYMCEEHAETDLDTAVCFLPALPLIF